jgi:hypothetical protein
MNPISNQISLCQNAESPKMDFKTDRIQTLIFVHLSVRVQFLIMYSNYRNFQFVAMQAGRINGNLS